MKKAVYWLMGDTAGRVTVNIWNWLWGLPPEDERRTADPLQSAETSLKAMQASVRQLAEAVSAQVAAYQKAALKYEEKVGQAKQYERQAIAARQNGDESTARLAMAKAIQLEQLLPQLEERVRQAEVFVKASQDRLNRERIDLEAYKADMEHMKDMAEMSQALDAIARVNSQLNIDSARSQFDRAKDTIEQRHLEEQALAEVRDLSSDNMAEDWETLTLDDEIDRRLQQSKRPPHQQ
ncbi:PspA/IM30 family protein [Baaleninema simplex]|uniref:PspA/IM30 family protein n=1 Tax=Baaleninema simplex TaxID=2862350 RepID=UPI000376694D|nr:PspA/IM30 family protein [Baaleninema simplex]